MSTPEATCIDILGKLKLDFFDDEWFQGKFLRHLLEKVISEGNRDKEAEIQAEEDIMMYPVKPPEFLKHLFFALHTLEEEHQKAKGRHVISQRQYEQLSDSAHRKKAKDQEALTKVVAKTMEKHKTRNFVLARRNQVNRLRTGAKAKVLREEEKHLPEPPRAKSRLTIFEKLEVVQFAEKLMQNREVFPPPKRIRSKAAPVRKRFRKGVNIQARCKLHFGERLGGIKVCNLIRKAREQQWDKLTIKQQKQHIQLTDSLKVSLGLEGTVKGWRSLTEAHVSQSLQENGSLRRWTVPGPVLEAGFRGVFLERILHSSLGSAARAEEYAHTHTHARTHAYIIIYIYII
jgi:hypothetical protein